jgi:hypothetical protein
MTGIESPVLRGFRVQRPDRGRLAAYRIRGSPLFLHPVRVRSLRETEGGPSMEGAQPGPCVHPDGEVSNALVKLHKEHFGRGPTRARSYFAGPDTLVSVLHDALLPAERKMVSMGDQNRVREARAAFQAATADEFPRRSSRSSTARCKRSRAVSILMPTSCTRPSTSSRKRPRAKETVTVDPERFTRRQELLRAEAAAMVRDSDSMRAADQRLGARFLERKRRTEPNAAELLAQDFSSTRRNASWWPLTTRSAISPTPRA